MRLELFPELPEINQSLKREAEMVDCGDGNFVTVYAHAEKQDYDAYQSALKNNGFRKYVDNGEGLADSVFCAAFIREHWCVHVTYLKKLKKMYLSIAFKKPLSKRLFYQEEYTAENQKDAKTKLYMRELWWFGNSFVIQLKNGHFLISDGGQADDARYLVEDLERLVSPGEKPVIEAWFISHGHMDHCGVFRGLLDAPDLLNRILVEGIYFSIVGDAFYVKDEYTRVDTAFVQLAAKLLKTTDGRHPEIYRPYMGERYYFSDITVDVVHMQEQLITEEATGDINDSSTLLMLNIEGQKCLLTGDAERGCMRTLMSVYDKSYLELDLMTLMHHGFNTRDEFTDYCKVNTLLITTGAILPVRQANENNHLKESVREYFSWGNGTKVLNFPYEVGRFQTLPKINWKYHEGMERKEQLNVRRYWKGQRKKEIRTLRITDHGLTEHVRHFVDKIHQHLPMQITEDGMMIEFMINPKMDQEQGYSICMKEPTGWCLCAADDKMLYHAIDIFLDTAVWTEKGFTAKERERGKYDE